MEILCLFFYPEFYSYLYQKYYSLLMLKMYHSYLFSLGTHYHPFNIVVNFNFHLCVFCKIKGHSKVLVYIYSIVLHCNMLGIITVHPFIGLILNLRVHMNLNYFIHMKYHCVLLANFYLVSNTWIVRIELKSNLFLVSAKVLIN